MMDKLLDGQFEDGEYPRHENEPCQKHHDLQFSTRDKPKDSHVSGTNNGIEDV